MNDLGYEVVTTHVRRIGLALVVLLSVACTDLGADPQPASRPAPTTTAPPGLFAAPTGHLLVFDDGYDGVLVVDPDRRIAMRRVVPGQTAGDQMPRLHRTGDDLIVGWGGIYAAPVTGGTSRLLSRATIAVPSAEPDQVWTVTWPGGRIGAGGDPTTRLLQVSTGESLLYARGPTAYPVTGIPGGLALQTEEGVGLWDARTEQIVEVLGHGSGFPADARAGRLAWCAGNCPTMHVTDLDSGQDRRFALPRGAAWYLGYEGELSPDGRHLATWTDDRAVLIDVDAGTISTLARVRSDYFGTLAWSPDGRTLYWSIRDEDRTARVGRLDLATGEREVAPVAVPGGGSLVVLDASEAPDLVIEATGQPEDCPAPDIQPSGRTEACAYRL